MRAFLGLLIFAVTFQIFLSGCKKDDPENPDQPTGGGLGINLFSIEDDKKLGADMDAYIRDSSGFILLDPNQYPTAYNYVNNLKTQILNSGHVKYRDDFEWKVTIIKDDTTLNAFATPGGYIYIYTGLIKYLSCDDHFAGVLGHEIAHADRRHSTRQLTKLYGVQLLLDIVLGTNDGAIAQVTQGLLDLSFSRDAEREADEYSVNYLCTIPNTEADGAAGFFAKLIAEGQSGGTPEFLSTHPSSESRVQDIQDKAESLNCDTEENCSSEYAQVVNSLP